ncbi:MAG: acyl-CoA synthetase [Alphaproteobacteria bacterium]
MTAEIISGARRRALSEIGQHARQAASALEALGVGEGDAVAIYLRNDFPFWEAAFGAVTLGAYAVPVNWHYKADEAGYVLRDCGAKAVVVHADLLPNIAEAIPTGCTPLVVPTPPEIAEAYGFEAQPVPDGAMAWEDFIAGQPEWNGPARQLRSTMIYTSGTTGRPKGVRRDPADAEHQAMIADVTALVMGMREGEPTRAVLTGPIYHSAPCAYAQAAARTGGLVVSMPRFDAEELLRLIERHRITHVHMVPTMFVRLLKLPKEVRAKYDVSSLRNVVHAAAPCPPHVKQAMIEWWGPVINEYYGATETGAVVYHTAPEALRKPGTVGKPVPRGEVAILDEDGQRLPTGEIGEVYLRLHAYPDFTYQNRPDARAECGRDHLVTAGDVGYVDDDGYLYLCDRRRDMVISGGVNIYPAEIEAVLIGMPGVKDCAIFGIPDEEFGESLACHVEPEPGADLGLEAVRSYLRERVAGYKVPKLIEIARDLPREDSGKIFKRKLREPYWQDAGRRI